MKKRDLTVAILAGGDSSRFKSEKSLAKFRGRPLISYMIEIASQLSDDTLVVVSNEEGGSALKEDVGEASVVVDPDGSVRCALTGAITAFEETDTRYTLLLPVDTPLANVQLLRTLYDLREGHGAVVPSWPSGYIEPLHSVYLAEHAYSQGLVVSEAGKYRMKDLLDSLSNVMYVSTVVLKEIDPDLHTFSNINTEPDLRELERSTGKRN
ncbi:MAG: molybdenum cofactor guanylyltransferase [Candidatus Thorarchaeota archaeon]|nr:MAG: molybdenum cofactor guanylyltransferase [Candidatus Thorarchaeota archaeon]